MAARQSLEREGPKMKIKVLGSGCSKCRSTIGIIERAALSAGIEVEIIKVENPEDIHRYGVYTTPAVVIGGKVVHAGGLPSQDEVHAWLKPSAIGFLTNRPDICSSRAKAPSARLRCQRPQR